MAITKSSVNPKEKARLAEIMKELEGLKDNPEGYHKATMAHSKAERYRMKRCKSAIAKRFLPIEIGSNVIRYYPSTGKLEWAVHPNLEKMGENPAHIRKDGTRYFSLPSSSIISAARLIHSVVHGEIPPDHEVYCVNNDPSDLRILNLRMRKTNRRYANSMRNISSKEAYRKIREAKERGE